MKRLILLLMFSSLFIKANSQEVSGDKVLSESKNTIYFSYGGPGFYFSVIYERTVIVKERYKIGVKGGIGSSFSSVIFPNEFNFPMGVYFLYGKRMHHLDIGMNVTGYILDQYDYIDEETYKDLKLLYVPSFCYRYQKREGGFVGRIGISPIININSVTNSFSPWIDVSLGWAF